MKKSFFTLILAAVVILATSCIKNTESEGVKAVRMGQASLLTAQAGAATTTATAQAALATAQAAYQQAQAAVQTAMAASENARAAREVVNNAAIAEQNRHDAAMNALNEQLATAQNALDKAAATNALAEENARSANALALMAKQKADLDLQIATQKLTAEASLLAAQQNLDQAKLDNIVATATAQKQNDVLMAQLKVQNLSDLASSYNNSYSAYLSVQSTINDLKNMVIEDQQTLAGMNKDIADSTMVQVARKAVATKTTDLATANSAVVTAKANDDAALAIIDALKLGKAGTPLATLKAANQVKLDAENVVYANITSEKLSKQAEINDADFQLAIAKANADLATANTDLATATANQATAITDTVAKAAVVATKAADVATAVTDTTAKSLAFYTTATYQHLNAGVPFSPARFVSPSNAKAAELQEQAGGIWNSLADKTDYDNAVLVYNAALLTLTNSRTALTTAKTALATANTDLATSKAAYTTATTAVTTATTAKTVAVAALKVQTDKMTVLTDALTAINARLTASNARILGYTNFDTWLAGALLIDPKTIDFDAKITAAMLVEDNTDPANLGTKQLLATAKLVVTNPDPAVMDATKALAAAKTALANAITSYTQNLPFDQQNVAYLSIQIDDLNLQIAAQTSILAQRKSVLDMWLEKIRLALA